MKAFIDVSGICLHAKHHWCFRGTLQLFFAVFMLAKLLIILDFYSVLSVDWLLQIKLKFTLIKFKCIYLGLGDRGKVVKLQPVSLEKL